HVLSKRSRGPFVPVNLGALPDSLMEGELFGSARGSFTGSTGDRKGLVEAAHGGTLFLDEIGDMPLATQVKLLRTLENNEVRGLENAIAHAIAVTEGDVLGAADLPASVRSPRLLSRTAGELDGGAAAPGDGFTRVARDPDLRSLDEVTREHVLRVLTRHEDN